MDKGTVVIVVNGILNLPGSASGWTDRAVTWFHTHTEARAEKFEYLALPLTRRLFQASRARRLAELIDSYRGQRIILVGHSNGCDLITRALRLTDTSIHAVHLIAAACESDFESNGLNLRLIDNAIGSVHVYIGERDWALKLAYYSSLVLSVFGLGYGSLGLTGPENLKNEQWKNTRVFVYRFPTYGHGTFFEKPVMPSIFQQIAQT